MILGLAGYDDLSGIDGDDLLVGGGGADTLGGGSGIDTASYPNALAGVVANLTAPTGNTGEAAGNKYASIKT